MTRLRKRYLLLATAIMLVAALALPGGIALAGHRIQDQGKGSVTLDREDGAPEQATGTAKFTLTDEAAGYHKVTVELEVEKLLPRAGNVYQAWLRDGGKNYDDAFATFQTDRDGDKTVTSKTSVPHFAEYDEVIVSTERKHDSDPTRNGEVVLRGELSH